MNAIERVQVKQDLQNLALGKDLPLPCDRREVCIVAPQATMTQILECWEAMEAEIQRAEDWKFNATRKVNELWEHFNI